jgi:hypothetical protein
MGVVIETCVKYPGGRTRIRGTEVVLYRYEAFGDFVLRLLMFRVSQEKKEFMPNRVYYMEHGAVALSSAYCTHYAIEKYLLVMVS